jgi:hypothetical protein
LDTVTELSAHLTGGARAIVITERELDLRPASQDNRLFLFKIGEGSLAAGGRGGGFGERKVVAVLCYEKKSGSWTRLFEAGPDSLEKYEVPYYVSRIPMTLADGTESMGYGVVEPELVAEISRKSGIPSSP